MGRGKRPLVGVASPISCTSTRDFLYLNALKKYTFIETWLLVTPSHKVTSKLLALGDADKT